MTTRLEQRLRDLDSGSHNVRFECCKRARRQRRGPQHDLIDAATIIVHEGR